MINKLTSDQMQLLGKLVKKKTHFKAETQIREIDMVSLSAAGIHQEEKVFIKYEDKELDLKQARAKLRKLGVKIANPLPSIGGYSAIVDTSTIEKLEKNGFTVISNSYVQIVPEPPTDAMTGCMNSPANALSGSTGGSFIKLDVASPSIGADLINNMGYTGKGVGIAIIDTGVAPHPDLINGNKLVAFKDFVGNREGVDKAYDDNGHGTHVAGDAAGSGYLSNGLYKGSAPDAHIVGLKVIDSTGGGNVAEVAERITKAIDWVIKHKDEFNIRVINMSLGLPHIMPDFEPVNEASEKAIKAGITVVVAAGNSGPDEGTINTEPGDNPNVITVGASDDHNTPSRKDDNVANFSSRGPTPKGITKPDIIAPGTEIMSMNVPGSELSKQALQMAQIREVIKNAKPDQLKQIGQMLVQQGALPADAIGLPSEQLRKLLLGAVPYMPMSGEAQIGDKVGPAYIGMPGTSMASPIVAGVVANMIEANPELTHYQIKDILMSTADKFLEGDANTQGAGYIDVKEAMEKVLALKNK
ncbi:MAG TPA: S8 family peptidase [Candidatus Eremiobacteraeota bacterium]|nr:MAG: Serine protease AprX [bacterium ADurb.Bin363]HPZ08022.1 S8 family peptidase [Candidatus Eremiobacteraeota bacterium]